MAWCRYGRIETSRKRLGENLSHACCSERLDVTMIYFSHSAWLSSFFQYRVEKYIGTNLGIYYHRDHLSSASFTSRSSHMALQPRQKLILHSVPGSSPLVFHISVSYYAAATHGRVLNFGIACGRAQDERN